MQVTVKVKVLCRGCKRVLYRDLTPNEAWMRGQATDGEWLATPKCADCVSPADIMKSGWWKPWRLHIQPVADPGAE